MASAPPVCNRFGKEKEKEKDAEENLKTFRLLLSAPANTVTLNFFFLSFLPFMLSSSIRSPNLMNYSVVGREKDL